MMYSELASNEEAWQEARDERGINSSLTFPSDEVAWATASTTDSTTLMQIEDMGFATSITVVAGSKYWVLGNSPNDEHGANNLGSIHAFENFSPEICPSTWNIEGVLLYPNDIL
jgi:hypothetical protein